ncbi:16371_t:CDS:2 [Gigaspora margarita]|uniref:16371_t:CDS:1 n=1 Tax=Gigaspora margarita TaxID=4874 RepID=A0ABM8W241_GIGMA|nr:16371_t:CDS:2 [Gigaspora margarita]
MFFSSLLSSDSSSESVAGVTSIVGSAKSSTGATTEAGWISDSFLDPWFELSGGFWFRFQSIGVTFLLAAFSDIHLYEI